MLHPPATVPVMADTPLPGPESERLAALVGGGSLRLVYGLLYRLRSTYEFQLTGVEPMIQKICGHCVRTAQKSDHTE